MFNLNESDRMAIVRNPADMRIGVNGMCGYIRSAGLDPTDGEMYIFVGKSRKTMKLLHWERGGYDNFFCLHKVFFRIITATHQPRGGLLVAPPGA